MIARVIRPRFGITLTEILIAILIMGVGLISLATLFPLGLLRLQKASQYSRAGLTFETAADDMDSRSLFYKPSFLQTWYWYSSGTAAVPRDPFVYDSAFNAPSTAPSSDVIASDPTSANGVYTNPVTKITLPLLQSGLPFCYDPLWRSLTGVVPNSGVYANTTLDFQANYATAVNEARFGDGLLGGTQPYLGNDPDGKAPSAHGLQRLSNFLPWSSNLQTPLYAFTALNKAFLAANQAQPADVSANIFTSNDDIVFNPLATSATSPSSVIPDMTSGQALADYKYTWFVTGRQTDAGGNGSQFTGEVVVCDSRPFGFDPLPNLPNSVAPLGETVVEAIFGYGSTKGNAGVGFALNADRTVLLRWKNTMADPDVRTGGWICDVTYERSVNTYGTRSYLGTALSTPFARCYWYQIGKRTDIQPDLSSASYRSMVVTLTSPVRVKTLLNNTTPPTAVHTNVALIMPSVINVYPRAFEVH